MTPRNRLIYGTLIVITIILGLASRRFFGDVFFVKEYVGDVFWALMVFLGFAFLFNRWSVKNVTLAALLFSFGIEISQLYHAPWIDSLRDTTLGALVLGFTFVWSDFICYSIGSGVGVLIDSYQNKERTTRKRKRG